VNGPARDEWLKQLRAVAEGLSLETSPRLSVKRHETEIATGSIPVPPPLHVTRDVVELLLEERQNDR